MVDYQMKTTNIIYKYDKVEYKTGINFLNKIKNDNLSLYCFGSFLHVLYNKKKYCDDIDLFYIGEYNKDFELKLINTAKDFGIIVDLFYLPNINDDDIIGNNKKTIIKHDVDVLDVYRIYSVKSIDNQPKYSSIDLTDIGYHFKFKNDLLYRMKDIENNNLTGIKHNPIKIF